MRQRDQQAPCAILFLSKSVLKLTVGLPFAAPATMDNFGFIIHPLDAGKDVARKYPFLGYLPIRCIHFISGYFPATCISHITGIRSAATGKEIETMILAL